MSGGAPPDLLGKDELDSSNLASSSKRTPIPLGIGVLFLFLDRTGDLIPCAKRRLKSRGLTGSHEACFVGERWPVQIWLVASNP